MTAASCTVRPARHSDAAALAVVALHVFVDAHAGHCVSPPVAREALATVGVDAVAACLRDGMARVPLAEREGRVLEGERHENRLFVKPR